MASVNDAAANTVSDPDALADPADAPEDDDVLVEVAVDVSLPHPATASSSDNPSRGANRKRRTMGDPPRARDDAALCSRPMHHSHDLRSEQLDELAEAELSPWTSMICGPRCHDETACHEDPNQLHR